MPLSTGRCASCPRKIWGAGADANVLDEDCRTLLHCARHAACVDMLVEARADLEARDEVGKTPLHFAVGSSQGHHAAEITQLLLEAGAAVHAVDHWGITPLHCVRHATCVDLLVDAGAELGTRDWEGRTPIYTVATDSITDRSQVVLRMADRGTDLVNTGGEHGLVMRRVEELRAQRSRDQAVLPRWGRRLCRRAREGELACWLVMPGRAAQVACAAAFAAVRGNVADVLGKAAGDMAGQSFGPLSGLMV